LLKAGYVWEHNQDKIRIKLVLSIENNKLARTLTLIPLTVY